ncbi:hypothetical protein [Paenibacillus cymbidii]|nr:hypothetical protein [Paenibacillus cymbidii]
MDSTAACMAACGAAADNGSIGSDAQARLLPNDDDGGDSRC